MGEVLPLIGGPARLYWFSGSTEIDARYLQVFNVAAPIAPGAVPLWSFRRGRDNPECCFLGPAGAHFTAGIVIAWSDTFQIYTPPGAPVNFSIHAGFTQ
jgi:hypothetical protein